MTDKPQESKTPECDDFIATTIVDHGKSESTIAALQGWTRIARSLERRLRAAEADIEAEKLHSSFQYDRIKELEEQLSQRDASEIPSDDICELDDGCPTEKARLQREWRQLRARAQELEERLATYDAFVGNELLMSDYKTVLDMRSAIASERAARQEAERLLKMARETLGLGRGFAGQSAEEFDNWQGHAEIVIQDIDAALSARQGGEG